MAEGVTTTIGDNGTRGRKRPVRVAIEDAITIFAYTLTVTLIAALPGLPSPETLYAGALVSGGAGVLSWAKARNINVGTGA